MRADPTLAERGMTVSGPEPAYANVSAGRQRPAWSPNHQGHLSALYACHAAPAVCRPADTTKPPLPPL